ncbi:MAG: hypothetical protein AAFU56_05760 [Pseudomonadota bacterium]
MLVSRAFLFVFLIAATAFVVSVSIQQMEDQDKIANNTLSGERVVVVEVVRENSPKLASLPNRR